MELNKLLLFYQYDVKYHSLVQPSNDNDMMFDVAWQSCYESKYKIKPWYMWLFNFCSKMLILYLHIVH